MRETLKVAAKPFGLGLLNLLACLGVTYVLGKVITAFFPLFDSLIITAILLIVYVAGCHWIERRKTVELSGVTGIADLAGGAAVGLALFSFVMALLWIIGVFRPTGWGRTAELGVGAYLSLLCAIAPCILLYGLVFRVVANMTGTWAAVVVVSLLFGLGSIFNPGATLWTSIATALEGTALGASYAATQRLWFTTSIFAGWNFAEGYLFSMPVSGGGQGWALIAGFLRGQKLLTGGAYGPEASVPAVAVCLTVTALLMWRTIRAGRLKQPVWSRIVGPISTLR